MTIIRLTESPILMFCAALPQNKNIRITLTEVALLSFLSFLNIFLIAKVFPEVTTRGILKNNSTVTFWYFQGNIWDQNGFGLGNIGVQI